MVLSVLVLNMFAPKCRDEQGAVYQYRCDAEDVKAVHSVHNMVLPLCSFLFVLQESRLSLAPCVGRAALFEVGMTAKVAFSQLMPIDFSLLNQVPCCSLCRCVTGDALLANASAVSLFSICK